MMHELLANLDFNLLRPWWLLGLLPAILLTVLLMREQNRTSGWETVIDPALLQALLDNSKPTRRHWPVWLALTGWALACCALSGPSFDKQSQAALKQADAVVILLDLSPSMLAQDIKPSRLQAAHYKILDLLKQRKEGYTGLVAYAGSAHVVAPLSDDTNTIAALVSTLEPRIMPSIGSQAEDAVSEALQLLENSHFNRGRLLLLTDGVVTQALDNIRLQLAGKAVELDVIGIGTPEGGPITLSNGTYLKDTQGNIVLNKLDETPLRALADNHHGYYSKLQTDDSDIAPLVAPPGWLAALGNDGQRDASHNIDHWVDSGYWFALPCLLVALLFFRRGTLPCLLLATAILMHPSTSSALDWPGSWQDWWYTPDQQGARALQRGDAATAASTFRSPQWKGYAEYQNGQHKEAAGHFAGGTDATAHYNEGNALARSGNLQAAIKAYDAALQQSPDFTDASFNRDLVKKLLEQQQQQKQQQDGQQNQQPSDGEQQDNSASSASQGSQDPAAQQQSPEQQSQEQQSQEQQSQEQQDPQQSTGNPEQAANQQQTAENQQSNEQQSAEQQAAEQQQNEQQAGQTAGEQQEQAGADTETRKAEDVRQSASDEEKNDVSNNPAANGMSQAEQEKQQATEQWLRKVPDDPGGLLKNKFAYYYKLNRQEQARKRRAGDASKEEPRW